MTLFFMGIMLCYHTALFRSLAVPQSCHYFSQPLLIMRRLCSFCLHLHVKADTLALENKNCQSFVTFYSLYLGGKKIYTILILI